MYIDVDRTFQIQLTTYVQANAQNVSENHVCPDNAVLGKAREMPCHPGFIVPCVLSDRMMPSVGMLCVWGEGGQVIG